MKRVNTVLLVLLASIPAALLVLADVACVPYPTNPGYIHIPSRPERGVGLAVHGGGGAEILDDGDSTGGGAGGLSVEPWLTPRLTLPVTAMGGGSSDTGGGAARVGIRYRPLGWMSVGGGVGGGLYGGSHTDDTEGAVHLDLEMGMGGRWGLIGLSVAMRPTFEVTDGWFLLPWEVALAVYPVEAVAITMHVYGGPWVLMEDADVGGWIAGGLGLAFHIPSKGSRPEE